MSHLSEKEKLILLAEMDGRNLDEYDRSFYEAMYRSPGVQPSEIEDGVRRAVLRFIADSGPEVSDPSVGGYIMMAFCHGYLVGRKLRRDIRRKGDDEVKITYLPK